MMILVIWIFAALFIGLVFGAARKIGFFLSFIASLLLSPVIGLIITLFSETNEKIEERKRMNYIQEGRNQTVSNADEMEKIYKLYQNGVLTKEEFEDQKKKLLSR